jgi:SAM-dependent methyltransferase
LNKQDLEDYLTRYNNRLDSFGYDPRSLGWGGGKERQYLRFDKTLNFVNFTSHPIHSILDVGCGFGDLGNWLSSHFPNINYTGIDINPNLVEIGKRNFGLNLYQSNNIYDFEENSFDLVISNGIFNAQLHHENQLDYLENHLFSFHKICRVGFSCDFMSQYVDFKHPGSYHTKEQDVIDIIKKLSKRYIIRNDYLDYEFMVYMFK